MLVLLFTYPGIGPKGSMVNTLLLSAGVL